MKNTSIPIWWQARRLTKLLLIIYVPIVAIFTVLAIQHRIPVTILLEDPAVYSEVPFYTGIISNIGGLLWASAAVVCGFTYYVVRATQSQQQLSWFLLSSAVITAFLAVDDLFLLHEQVLPEYLNVPELIVFPIYALAVFVYLWRFHHILRRSEYILLLLAFSFFALSVIVDNFEYFTPDHLTNNMRAIAADNNIVATTDQYTSPLHAFRLLMEDGAKLMGIIAWAAYFIRFCHQVMVKVDVPNAPMSTA